MISQEVIRKLARQYHAPEHPNIVREYFQHLFLSEFYKLEDASHLLFKGGTALRIVYQSPRFSEDLDFTMTGVRKHREKWLIEHLFTDALAGVEHTGVIVTLGSKLGPTSGGYYGDATFRMYDYEPVNVAINISARSGRGVKGEIDTIAGEFIPAYSILHLAQEELVDEKIFGALLNRGKPRDFYDLYFIMRRGMLSATQKKAVGKVQKKILAMAEKVNFRSELSVFLPSDQQKIIRGFPKTLADEMKRQLSGI
jgi:predicted nucleotidyltransferase component of viral defense system